MSQALHCTSCGVCSPISWSWHTAWQVDAGHQVRQGSRSTSRSNCSFLYLCIISAATMHSISFSCRWPCLGQAASGQLMAVSNPSLIKSSTYCFRHRVQKMHWHWAMVVICSTGYSPRHSLQDTSGSRARSHVGRHRAVVMAERSLRSPDRGRGPVFWPNPDVLMCSAGSPPHGRLPTWRSGRRSQALGPCRSPGGECVGLSR